MKKLIIAVAILVVLAFLFRDYLNIDYLLGLIESVRGNPFAPFIFILIYAVSVTFAVPASALTLISGPLFGFWQGLILTIIASNLGCHITYWFSKILGKDVIFKYIKPGSFMDTATKKAQENGFIFMMYVRLLPIFPFAAVNYLTGLLNIKYKHYAIATFLGMLPGSAVYVYLGYSASNIQDNPIGLIISIAVLVLFTVVVTLAKKFGEKKQHKGEKHA